MKQKGVTKEAISLIIKECLLILDKQGITPVEAFNKPSFGINTISISGRTLRKIFKGKQVHVNTISKVIQELGKENCLTNGKIDIKHEEEIEA